MEQAHDYVQGMLNFAMYRNQTDAEMNNYEEEKVNQTDVKPSRNEEVLVQDSQHDTNAYNSVMGNKNNETINDANSSIEYDPLGQFQDKRGSGKFFQHNFE